MRCCNERVYVRTTRRRRMPNNILRADAIRILPLPDKKVVLHAFRTVSRNREFGSTTLTPRSLLRLDVVSTAAADVVVVLTIVSSLRRVSVAQLTPRLEPPVRRRTRYVRSHVRPDRATRTGTSTYSRVCEKKRARARSFIAERLIEQPEVRKRRRRRRRCRVAAALPYLSCVNSGTRDK